MTASVILGAGFSYVAGLPLTRGLFQEFPAAISDPSRSDSSRQSCKEVKTYFDAWAKNNPDANAEKWLAELYADRENPLQTIIHGTTWDGIMEFEKLIGQ